MTFNFIRNCQRCFAKWLYKSTQVFIQSGVKPHLFSSLCPILTNIAMCLKSKTRHKLTALFWSVSETLNCPPICPPVLGTPSWLLPLPTILSLTFHLGIFLNLHISDSKATLTRKASLMPQLCTMHSLNREPLVTTGGSNASSHSHHLEVLTPGMQPQLSIEWISDRRRNEEHPAASFTKWWVEATNLVYEPINIMVIKGANLCNLSKAFWYNIKMCLWITLPPEIFLMTWPVVTKNDSSSDPRRQMEETAGKGRET